MKPVLNEEEVEAKDAIVKAYAKVQNLAGGLSFNATELAHAVHTMQMFVYQHALNRHEPELYSSWYTRIKTLTSIRRHEVSGRGLIAVVETAGLVPINLGDRAIIDGALVEITGIERRPSSTEVGLVIKPVNTEESKT